MTSKIETYHKVVGRWTKPTCGLLYAPKPIKTHVCDVPSKIETFFQILFCSLVSGSMFCCSECSQFYIFDGSLKWKKCLTNDSCHILWCDEWVKLGGKLSRKNEYKYSLIKSKDLEV